MLYVAAILLVQALAVHASVFSHTYPGDDIEALCSGKSIELVSISQLQKLDEALASSSCSLKTKHAIADLIKVIKQGQTDLCSSNSIENLREFYLDYLHTSPSTYDPSDDLPKSLKRFALAYGMQTSDACKKNALDVLLKESQQLEGEDLKPFAPLISDESPISQLLSSIGEPGEIYLPGDLAPLFKKKGSQEKLFLQSSAGDQIKKVQSTCEQHFKPIYGPLMAPLVRLANLGFSYKSALECSPEECPATVKSALQWSAVIFLCEAMGNIQIVEEQSDKELAGDTGSKLVRILTKEEAARIEGASVDAENAESASTEIAAPAAQQPSHVAFTNDLILDKTNKRLVKAIKSLKTDMDEGEVIKSRLASKGLSLIKKELKRGHFRLILSAAWKRLIHRADKSPDMSVQIVKSLNEMMERQEAALDGAVSKVDSYGMDWAVFASHLAFFAIIICVIAGGIVGLTIALSG